MILDQNKVFADNADKVKTLATELLKKMKDDTAMASDFSDFKLAVEKIFEVCFLGDEKLKYVSIASSNVATSTEEIEFFIKPHTKAEYQSLFKRLLTETN